MTLCVIQGPAGTVSGYGAHCRDIIRATIKAYPDWDIKIIDTRWGNTPRNYLMEKRDDDILSRMLKEPLQKQPDIYIPILVPNEFKPIGKFNVGITAGIETTICDPKWIDGMNRMQLNIVPSEHAKTVFENTKFKRKDNRTNQIVGELQYNGPIEVLFEGVDTKIYKQTNEISKTINNTLNEIKEDFCFLFVGHWTKGDFGHDRKDVGMLIKTFCESFKNKQKKPALVLKTSGASFSVGDREDILKKINMIRNDNTLPNVYLLHGDLSDIEMNSLYNHPKIKVMVSFTHGEGYGRPFAEFACSKKPIIAPNWSGQIDFLNKEYSTLLPGELNEVHSSAIWKGIINEGSKWFYVNYFYASQIIKEVYKHYSKFTSMAKKQANLIWTKFTLDKMSNKLKIILDKYIPEFPEEIELKLPKLKKIDLPKLKKIDKE